MSTLFALDDVKFLFIFNLRWINIKDFRRRRKIIQLSKFVFEGNKVDFLVIFTNSVYVYPRFKNRFS